MPPRLTGHDRRRRLLVNRVQTTYVVVQLAWTAAFLAVFAALVFGPTAYVLYTGSADERQRAAGLFLDMHTRFWPALIALAASLGMLIVVQSHRILGPLVRFRTVFEAVAAGNLCVPARIRASDYPQDEGRALEEMVRALRASIGNAQAAAARLQHALHEPGGGAHAAAEAAALRQALDSFRTGPSAVPPAGVAVPPVAAWPPGTGTDGFSLVEVLLVSCVIGVLAAVAVPGYEAALEKARVTRAIGDIRSLQAELQTYGIVNGCYPDSLTLIGYATLRDPWGSAYSYGVLAGAPGAGGKGGKGGAPCAACGGTCLGRGQARKDRNLVPINSDFDLYSVGRDRQSVGPLSAKASLDDVVRASDGGFIGLGRDY